MERSKRKNIAHIIGEQAEGILRKKMPKHWTVRDYRPDYGIDLSIEVFEKTKIEDEYYDSMGEHFFIQLKGVSKAVIQKHKIKKRFNVEKKIKKETKIAAEIDVVKFSLDTPLLFTVQRMSNVIPVMLFVVDVETEDIYYVNLNDYIDKVLLPDDHLYSRKKKKTIIIPTNNKLTDDPKSLIPIKFYAKRPKFYSYFNKVNYQRNELFYVSDDALIEQLKRFADILLTIDIWEDLWIWPLFDRYKKCLFNFANGKEIGLMQYFVELDDTEEEWESDYSYGKLYTRKKLAELSEARQLWDLMSKLYDVYDEVCREMFLPTMINFPS